MAKVTFEIEGAVQTIPLVPVRFKTGSIGFRGIGKVRIGKGKKYQVITNVVLVGSRPNPRER